MKRWRCDSSSCKNQGHYCWQPEGRANIHLKLSDIHIRKWNKAISQGKDGASVEEPPKKIKTDLFEWQKQQLDTPKAKKERTEDVKKGIKIEKKEKIEAAAQETPLWTAQMVSPMTLPGFQMPASPFQNPWQQMPSWMAFQPSLPIQQTAYNMSSQHQEFGQDEPVLPSYQSKTLPSQPSTAENRREIHQKSNPVQVVGSQESLRQEYMSWHVGRNPSE